MSHRHESFPRVKSCGAQALSSAEHSGNLSDQQRAVLLADAIRVGVAAASVPGWYWTQIDMSKGPGACWPWTGKLDADGYGLAGGLGRASRVACAVANGPSPAKGMHACHSTACETRACCNPAHLRWDTAVGNQADVAIVGSRRGVRHPIAKLTEEQVREIWSRRGQGYVTVARALGTPPAATRHVLDGSNWSHITKAVA